MTRRVSLPGVDELFRSSGTRAPESDGVDGEVSLQVVKEIERPVVVATVPAPEAEPVDEVGKRPRHDEKVTFYCTADDLTRIEAARLALRAEHKLASDRGRIVRAALAEILDDFDRNGGDSALVRRLQA